MRAEHHGIINRYFNVLSSPQRYDEKMDEIRLDSVIGEGKINRLITHSGIECIESNLNFNKRRIVSFQSNAAMVELSFCFQGNAEVCVSDSAYELEPNCCTLQFMKDFQVSFDYGSQSKLQTMAIGIPLFLFDSYMQEVGGRTKTSFADILGTRSFRMFRTSIGPETLQILNQLRNFPSSSSMRRMYVESKALELFSLYFESLLFERDQKYRPSRLSRSDRDKIKKAEELLLSHMADPPSLIELSRMCGVNDFKLKIGFKEQFGKSVFSYLRDKRMEKAWSLLRFENMSVSQTAQIVGYSNFSHFAEVFRKSFDCSPSDVRRERHKQHIVIKP
ncbi:helix-turn-helix domain-containing protein [Paenibacillus sp. Leaf72]|uniref:helix-turn-helix domain-containing protein n=1 Tax=Paenibacillus sp. Leaf72 TaxID=1736234 RepID=UPI0006FD8A09|nr:AraC family transcriptional regulator [Paenibacillus sp. Leaf72]KQO15405.1 hypothetical protein ASF12_28480 [Paenibacillus sp. Leaf72]